MVLMRAQGNMRQHMLDLHSVAVASVSAASAPTGSVSSSSSSADVSHKSAVTDCARSLELTIREAMKELQVLAATSTPILQRFARFFTDILHESCRAIIINTAVGRFSSQRMSNVVFFASLLNICRFISRSRNISVGCRPKLATHVRCRSGCSRHIS